MVICLTNAIQTFKVSANIRTSGWGNHHHTISHTVFYIVMKFEMIFVVNRLTSIFLVNVTV